MEAIEKPLADIFSKLPVWPDSLKEALRKFYPWLLIIGSVFSGIAALGALGIGSFVYALVPVNGTLIMIGLVLLGLRAILGLYGGFRMLSGSKQGWDFAMYSNLIAVLANVLDFNIGGLIGNFLMLWALFQIREYYVSDGSGSSGSM